MRHGGIVERTAGFLPYGLKSVLGYEYKKHMYIRYAKQRFGARFRPRDAGPLAPPELIKTEALMNADDLRFLSKPQSYFGSGYREAWTVLTILEQYGANIEAMRSILEFGCGSARVIRHFRHIDGLRLAGTDANAQAIEWDKKNLPGIEFSHNALQPPLAYADATFDLVYALSVFTHIPLQWQRAWLDELSRVLRPDGYLLCTVHGDRYVSTMLDEHERMALKRDGGFALDAGSPHASYSSKVLGSWDVFQTREQVRETFSAGLELLCYTTHDAAAGQDTLVLRKSASAS
jgi:SAM-dependent methyltransferase